MQDQNWSQKWEKLSPTLPVMYVISALEKGVFFLPYLRTVLGPNAVCHRKGTLESWILAGGQKIFPRGTQMTNFHWNRSLKVPGTYHSAVGFPSSTWGMPSSSIQAIQVQSELSIRGQWLARGFGSLEPAHLKRYSRVIGFHGFHGHHRRLHGVAVTSQDSYAFPHMLALILRALFAVSIQVK